MFVSPPAIQRFEKLLNSKNHSTEGNTEFYHTRFLLPHKVEVVTSVFHAGS